MFFGRDGEAPVLLDLDPVYGVLTPVRSVIGFPLFGTSCALGAVGTGRHGNEVLRVRQVVGVAFPLLGKPYPCAPEVSVAEWNLVVNVELGRGR